MLSASCVEPFVRIYPSPPSLQRMFQHATSQAKVARHKFPSLSPLLYPYLLCRSHLMLCLNGKVTPPRPLLSPNPQTPPPPPLLRLSHPNARMLQCEKSCCDAKVWDGSCGMLIAITMPPPCCEDRDIQKNVHDEYSAFDDEGVIPEDAECSTRASVSSSATTTTTSSSPSSAATTAAAPSP